VFELKFERVRFRATPWTVPISHLGTYRALSSPRKRSGL